MSAADPSTPIQGHPRFAFIDALRGLGALGVACYHIHRYRPLRGPVDSVLPEAVQTILRYGWVGVPAFFVIAGFVTAYSLRNQPPTLAAAGNFALRRVVRLGVPYWTTILIVAALDAVARYWWRTPSLSAPIGWGRLAANLAFLQDILGCGNISAGTWFVCIDLQLGVLFALLWWLSRRWRRGGSRGQDAAATCLFASLGLLSLFVFNFDPRCDAWIIYFFCMPALGALTWWTLDNRLPRGVFWGYALAMVVRAAASDWRRLEIILSLCAGASIYAAGRLGRLGVWLNTPWLQYVGRISYSLFLIHYAAGWVVVVMGHTFTDDQPAFAVFWLFLAMVVSIGAAHLMYVFVEEPSVRFSRRLKNRCPTETAG